MPLKSSDHKLIRAVAGLNVEWDAFDLVDQIAGRLRDPGLYLHEARLFPTTSLAQMAAVMDSLGLAASRASRAVSHSRFENKFESLEHVECPLEILLLNTKGLKMRSPKA